MRPRSRTRRRQTNGQIVTNDLLSVVSTWTLPRGPVAAHAGGVRTEGRSSDSRAGRCCDAPTCDGFPDWSVQCLTFVVTDETVAFVLVHRCGAVPDSHRVPSFTVQRWPLAAVSRTFDRRHHTTPMELHASSYPQDMGISGQRNHNILCLQGIRACCAVFNAMLSTGR